MRSFSLKAFVVIALVHIVGTMLLLDAAVSRIKAFEHGETFLWLTILLWLWEPVPMLLSHYVHLNPSRFFYCLTLLWSLCVGAGFGFLLPRLLRSRRQIA
jgi:hypothetical protein